MQSMGRSMDWTLEDDMVDGLFFCTSLTEHRKHRHSQGTMAAENFSQSSDFEVVSQTKYSMLA